MKLPINSIIATEKLKNYLLEFRERNDKSKWLENVGYTRERWKVLEFDIRKQLLSKTAIPIERNQFGQLYQIKGLLKGPNYKTINVCSIWIKEFETGNV